MESDGQPLQFDLSEDEDVSLNVSQKRNVRRIRSISSSDFDDLDDNDTDISVHSYAQDIIQMHTEVLISGLRAFLIDHTLTDVVISVQEETFNCHKIILATFSTFFKSMFTSGMIESDQNATVGLPNIEPNIMRKIIQFMYVGEGFDSEFADEMLLTADYLQIESIKTVCLKQIKHKLNCNNIFKYWRLSEENVAYKDLRRACKNLVAKNFKLLWSKHGFVQLSCNQIVALLQEENLNVSDENIVCDAVDRWIKHDIAKRKRHLASIFENVRLPLASEVNLLKFKTEFPYSKDSKLDEFLKEAKCFHEKYDRQSLLVGQSKRTSYRLRVRQEHVIIVLAGGEDDSNERSRAMWSFWPSLMKWKRLSDLPKEVHSENSGPAICSYGLSNILYSGGYENDCFYRYDGKHDKWIELPHLNHDRAGHSMIVIKNCVYVFGGMAYDHSPSAEFLARKSFKTIDVYNMTDQSTGQDAEKSMFENHKTTDHFDEKLDRNDDTSSIKSENESDNDDHDDCGSSDGDTGGGNWTRYGKLLHPIVDGQVVVDDEKIYIFGGVTVDNEEYDTNTCVQCYDTYLKTCYIFKHNDLGIQLTESKVFGCDNNVFILSKNLKSFSIISYFKRIGSGSRNEEKIQFVDQSFTKFPPEGFLKSGNSYYFLGGMDRRISNRVVRYNLKTKQTSIFEDDAFLPSSLTDFSCLTLVLEKDIYWRNSNE